MTNTSNLSLIAIGLSEVREGSEITAGGVAKMAEGIVASWASPIRWTYGKGDNEVSGISTLRDMFKPRRHDDGSEDSKFLPAMYRAVQEVFLPTGDEFTNADKMQFKRAWQIAAAKAAGVEIEFVDADILRNGKRAKVRAVEVPASVAFDLYDENGVPTAAGKVLESDVKRSLKRSRKKADESAVREMAEETPIECVGGKIDGLPVPSVSVISDRLAAYAIDAGLMPSKSSRATRVPAVKFTESVDYVSKCLTALNGKDESEFAPSDELDGKLVALRNLIVAYLG
jgi:hypothetical protein